MNLQENIQRIRQMMSLNEQDIQLKVKASVNGKINFFDKESQKVYVYRLEAKGKPITIKSLDDETGDIVYVNPLKNEEEKNIIDINKLNEIKEKISDFIKNRGENDKNFPNFYDLLPKSIYKINLVFDGEHPLQIVK